MNKILSLFNEQFVRSLLEQEILPQYPGFVGISRVTIKPYKELVWETTYHVVIKYRVYFLDATGQETKIPIICVAHSEEPRDQVYAVLKYLWSVGFSEGSVEIPKPLFYSDNFRGTFYRGLEGDNLLHYIKEKKWPIVTAAVKTSAELFARLHAIPAGASENFNPLNSRIRTVIPDTTKIFAEMTARYGHKYDADLQKIYHRLMEMEEQYFNEGGEQVLIHGDAHPENILITGAQRIGLIDFADFCLGDLARDLGAFCQQLDYKIISKAGEPDRATEMKTLFINTYLKAAKRELTPQLQARIDLYYNWTAMRTATYWFLKFGHNEERAEILLKQVKNNLSI